MDIGIELPSTIRGIPARQVLEWAAAAERASFSTLGVIDRVVYANLDPVPTLSAAAAVIERIGLTTAVLIGPLPGQRRSARQAAGHGGRDLRRAAECRHRRRPARGRRPSDGLVVPRAGA